MKTHGFYYIIKYRLIILLICGFFIRIFAFEALPKAEKPYKLQLSFDLKQDSLLCDLENIPNNIFQTNCDNDCHKLLSYQRSLIRRRIFDQ